MPRWEPDAVGRLQAAALDLFAEQGFERTTIEEISRRAGLSKRSFFNHFGDKREVLFGPVSEMQRETVTREIAACPETLPPLEAVVRGLQAAADAVFEARRDAATRRRDIVEANPELWERELRKQAALTDAVAAALRARGVDPDTALLCARAGMVVHQTAMRRWTRSTDGRSLRDHLSDALDALRATAAQTAGQGDADAAS
ncbi:TetR/AcrR family transcriptional regulator [Actinoallomurus rhizosphaericola]|uniref:TetR/AcrR family transcriptional regulator n=1 Tax=Actinoallomurus rhizosphaericola TaxID=2952536 RepID=UPI002090A797|nr:TetR/AcrR family transcriptional regulator [Actinoallomurus rhizosphaericola]MCO5991759.1 TetR/AcrR family transcriptional regulator [Actinoallomurus rhizosphaericola]